MSTPFTKCRARGLLRLGYDWNKDFVLEWNGQEEIIKEWNLETPPPSYAEIDAAEEGGAEWERSVKAQFASAKESAMTKLVAVGLTEAEASTVINSDTQWCDIR